MTPRGPVRMPTPLPLQALLDAYGRPDLTDEVLAAIVGVTRRTVRVAVDDGLSAKAGDRWACAMGLHPGTVWGAAFDEACDVEEHLLEERRTEVRRRDRERRRAERSR